MKFRPICILQVVGGMNRAGYETWLMHILRYADCQRFKMDFLVHTAEPCAYDEEIRALGSKIIPCLHPSRPWQYAHNLSRVLTQQGPYDIVHSHVHHYSGLVLRVAAAAGVPMRIAHSHNDTSRVDSESGWLRKVYLRLTEHWIQRYASIGLAASKEAAAALFGQDWGKDPRWQVLHYGIDLTQFTERFDSKGVRAELGLPENHVVIGHVGRFVKQKNHRFLVQIAREVCAQEPNVRFILVGDGPLRPLVEQEVARSDLGERFVFTGVRPDVPRLMLGAMDVFLLPSLWEGLPLVLIEAQAAGLTCVISDVISEEVDADPRLIHRLPLEQNAKMWTEALLACIAEERIPKKYALDRIKENGFGLQKTTARLLDVYRRFES